MKNWAMGFKKVTWFRCTLYTKSMEFPSQSYNTVAWIKQGTNWASVKDLFLEMWCHGSWFLIGWDWVQICAGKVLINLHLAFFTSDDSKINQSGFCSGGECFCRGNIYIYIYIYIYLKNVTSSHSSVWEHMFQKWNGHVPHLNAGCILLTKFLMLNDFSVSVHNLFLEVLAYATKQTPKQISIDPRWNESNFPLIQLLNWIILIYINYFRSCLIRISVN